MRVENNYASVLHLQKQRFVERLLIGSLIVNFFAFILILLARDPSYPLLYQLTPLVMATVVEVFAYYKAKQGNYAFATRIFLIAMFIAMCFVSFLIANTIIIVTLLHFMAIAVAVFFINQTTAKFYGLIVLITHIVIILFQEINILPQPATTFSSEFQVPIILFAVIVVFGFLFTLIARSNKLVRELNATLDDLQRVRHALKRRDGLFSDIFNHSPISALIQEFENGKLIENIANPAFFAGKEYDNFDDFKLADPVHYNEVVNTQLKESIQSDKTSFTYEVDIEMADGNIQIVEIHVYIHRDEQGQPIRIIRQGAYVTEERKFKRELLESNAQLSQTLSELEATQDDLLKQEVKFSNFFMTTPVATIIVPYGVGIHDFDESNLQINSACLTFFGYESLEAMYALKDTNPEQFKYIFAFPRLEEAMRNGVDELRTLDQHYKKDGTAFWADVIQYVERDEDGNPIRFVAQGLDATERVQQKALLEERVNERTADLQKANDALEVASTRKDEFLAMMSHELRTPLNTILARAQALQWGVYGKLEPKQINSIIGIESSGAQLLNLIQDVLDVSKIAAGEMTVDFTDVNVTNVCTESINSARMLATKKSQAIILNFQHSQNDIVADEVKLRQILDNLLSNAIKFTPNEAQIGLTVTESNKDEIVFTVWDQGIGIAEDKLDLLFKPFMQIDSRLSREYEGTGLGLSLVKQLAEIHGGGVVCESTVGEGSRFIVTIPYRPRRLADSKDHGVGVHQSKRLKSYR